MRIQNGKTRTSSLWPQKVLDSVQVSNKANNVQNQEIAEETFEDF